MLPSDGGSAFSNYDPTIVAQFDQLRDACQACADADEAQAQQMLSWVEKFENWCYGKAVDQYHQEGQHYVTEMWQRYEGLLSAYQTSVQPSADVARNLHAQYTETWQTVAQALTPIVADVETRKKQTHWTGRSAGDYMKQLPIQTAALQEFGAFLQVGGDGVETPALIQQGIFTTTMTFVGQTSMRVAAYAHAQVSTSSFFQRSKAAGEYLSERLTWFQREVVEGAGWRPALDSHIAQMTSAAVTSPSVLTKGTWPNATNTDTSSLPTTIAPKYDESKVGA